MIEKKFLLMVLLLPFFVGCFSNAKVLNKAKLEDGVFYQKNDSLTEVHIKNDEFFVLQLFKDKNNLHENCCDTLSHGSLKYDDNEFIEISSNDSLDKFFLNLEVNEEDRLPKDKLYIRVDNPIEKIYKKNKNERRALKYLIEIGSNNDRISRHFAYQIHNKNEIEVLIPYNFEINFIEVTTYIEAFIPIKNKNIDAINSFYYEVKNIKANYFVVNIPDLNYEYLNYKKINNDYIRIVNSDVLLWDGEEYVRK